jgi:hypothetical protein
MTAPQYIVEALLLNTSTTTAARGEFIRRLVASFSLRFSIILYDISRLLMFNLG